MVIPYSDPCDVINIPLSLSLSLSLSSSPISLSLSVLMTHSSTCSGGTIARRNAPQPSVARFPGTAIAPSPHIEHHWSSPALIQVLSSQSLCLSLISLWILSLSLPLSDLAQAEVGGSVRRRQAKQGNDYRLVQGDGDGDGGGRRAAIASCHITSRRWSSFSLVDWIHRYEDYYHFLPVMRCLELAVTRFM
jgi:hypothetical protein